MYLALLGSGGRGRHLVHTVVQRYQVQAVSNVYGSMSNLQYSGPRLVHQLGFHFIWTIHVDNA